MIVDVTMPKMGESVMEGTIIKWFKKIGDNVKKDETIFEISTDKVDTEVPSPEEGIISEILFSEGTTIEVGKVVAKIESASNFASVHNPQIENEKKIEQEVVGKSQSLLVNEQNEIKNKNGSSNIVEITMPKMGESVMEGTIIKWHKKAGDNVKKDETIFEISTDKVDTEVPSPADGILSEIIINEQQTVEVGTIVAKLISQENLSLLNVKKDEAKLIERKIEEKISQPSNKFYSPLVMNIAKKENISFEELESIEGSGISSRVTKNDVLKFLENRNKVQIKITQPKQNISQSFNEKKLASESFETNFIKGDVERIPMDNIRQKIMQHMIKSRDTSVHISAMIEVDMTKIYSFIQKSKDSFYKSEGIKLTYLPFIAQAVVKALKEFPLVNSTIEGTTILQKKFINLGIAVAILPNGLIVPNIKNAQEKNIIGIAKSIVELAEKSRTKKLSPDDISGGTFTITNYGVFGLSFGTPIINQPEVAILGIGTVAKKPVVIESDESDMIAIKPMMYLTLSHDHRLIDGMLAGKFLVNIKNSLENFSETKLI